LLIFVLSVANLAYQGHLTRGRKALLLILRRGRFSEEADVPPPEPALRGVAQARPGTKTALPRSVSEEEERLQEGIVGPARAVRRPSASRGRQPTPLDGVNHTLPVLSPRGGNGVAVSEKVPDKSAAGPEFRFTSAVEVPPPDEIERRGREQLVVTGAVCGPDGRGLGAVIVYLVDDQGNRVGQSCRSLPETGEFKVHVNSPGRYVLHGYKRGFVEDSSEAPILPLESGKIEGYMLRMIPDGCVVHGKVVTDAASPAPAGMEVRCVCEGGAAGGIASTDSAGRFRIFGVSSDATCRIEVRNASGEVVFCSEPFETSGHREVHRELSFSVAAAHEDSGQGSAETAASSERDHEFPDPPVPPVTGPVS
ncbi:MAG: hypothetical protein LDL33_03085, partial [Desulfomonile sp.]|nr:hypothetical protein [Desulfomonile sp.]